MKKRMPKPNPWVEVYRMKDETLTWCSANTVITEAGARNELTRYRVLSVWFGFDTTDPFGPMVLIAPRKPTPKDAGNLFCNCDTFVGRFRSAEAWETFMNYARML